MIPIAEPEELGAGSFDDAASEGSGDEESVDATERM